jgi:DNA-binding transcriptional ArsR family regulator
VYFISDMRPPKQTQSRFLKPLDEMLGTPANVRLLRVLALRKTAMTAGELAKRANLSRTSIYPALRHLERAGILEFIGAGAQRLIQLRDRHQLSRILREIFRAEGRRFEVLAVALRELFLKLPHRPLSAWVDETADESQAGDTLNLYFVARPQELDTITDLLNAQLTDLERKYDVHIPVRGLTRSELDTSSKTSSEALSAAELVAGVPPLALTTHSRSQASGSVFMSHAEHDESSRRLALAIAAKIRKDPGLISIAEEHVRHRADKASSRERRELSEWARILSTMSSARLQRFLVEDSERAARLRQTLPALNLLAAPEREAVLRSKTDEDAIAAVTRR